MRLSSGVSDHSIREGRAWWLLLYCLLGIGICILRLAWLQIVKGHALLEASESNHTQVLVERAPRGRILDRNGVILADDQPVFVALFSPLGLSGTEVQQSLSRLAGHVGLTPGELERRLRGAVRSKSMRRLSDRLSREQAFRILQDRPHLPGVSLTIEEQRFYPRGESACHVLGYVGQITETELEKFSDRGYTSGDWIGKTGLEREYDPVLHGQDGGLLIEVDVFGRQMRVLRRLPPKAGRDLYLTMDVRLQELAEKRLHETEHPGAAIVMDPRSGEVLAIASVPGFDPNIFLPLGDSEKRRELLNDKAYPLYNRAIQALYPPGSVFKIITSLAGLENGSIQPEREYYCTGSFSMGKERRVFRCWKKKGHGSVNFRRGLAESCDVYYYEVGGATGPQRIEDYAKMFRFGQKTGIDLPSEKGGSLPFESRQAKRIYWVGGETLNYAIGQGALQVTPMQIASFISSVASKGIVWKPFVVAESRYFGQLSEKLGAPQAPPRLEISDRSWTLVRDTLVQVVAAGTGVAAQLSGITVAGKTGTAQASTGGDHAWFAAYAPANDPKVACAVVVEHGGHGAAVAAPIAHDLLALALGVNKGQSRAPVLSEVSGD